MPTTLTGLLLFVVLLLPGFAYLVGKERNGTERHTSPFRETVAIVAASVTSEIAVLILFATARWWWPSSTPDVGALVRHGSIYLSGHYRELAVWVVCMLGLAVVLAYAATVPAIRQVIAKLPFTRPYPHDSTVSAWWIMFERWAEGRQVQVGCILDDGSYLRGNLETFNNSADDAPDRDLVLREPIMYRPPGDDEESEYPVGAVSVAARHIVTLFVNYVEQVTSASGAEEPVPETSTAVPQS